MTAPLSHEDRGDVRSAPAAGQTPNLNKALAAFQAEMPVLERDREVEVETKGDKPNYGYSYATLANVTASAMPLLGKHGLSFTAFPGTGSDGKMAIRYALLHESGEERPGEFPLSAEGGIQALGGRITYIRRYCLLAVTGLAAREDDDAAQAQAEDEANAGTTRRAAPATPKRGRSTAAHTRTAAEPSSDTTPARRAGDGPDLPAAPGGKDRKALDREVFALFRELGLGGKDDREARLALVQNMTGREVSTSTELTDPEIAGVIDAVRKALKTDAPMTEAVAIYQRTSGGDQPPSEPVRERPAPSERQPGQPSRTAREAVYSGDEGTEDAPWEGQLPV